MPLIACLFMAGIGGFVIGEAVFTVVANPIWSIAITVPLSVSWGLFSASLANDR